MNLRLLTKVSPYPFWMFGSHIAEGTAHLSMHFSNRTPNQLTSNPLSN